MVADYLHYFGPLDPAMSWSLFLSCVGKVTRYDARERLTLFDAVRDAIGAAFGGEDSAGALAAARTELTEQAYPVRFERQAILNGRGHG